MLTHYTTWMYELLMHCIYTLDELTVNTLDICAVNTLYWIDELLTHYTLAYELLSVYTPCIHIECVTCSYTIQQGFMQDKIIASHTSFGGHIC